MKKTAIVLMIAGILIVAGTALVVVGALSADHGEWTVPEAEVRPVSVEITDDFDELEIAETSGDIVIKVSDDGKCRIETWETDAEKPVMGVSGDTLCVKRDQQKKWKLLWDVSVSSDQRTTIYLPEDHYKKLCIESSSGNICIAERLDFGTVSVESVSGDIEIAEVNADDEMKISTTSGNLLFSNAAAEKIGISSTSGNAMLSEISCGSLKMDSTSGDFLLEDVFAENSAEMETTSGDITFDRLKCRKIDIETTSGDVGGSIVGPILCYYPETTSGSVRVPDITYGDDGSCRIETTSGDIRITEINE